MHQCEIESVVRRLWGGKNEAPGTCAQPALRRLGLEATVRPSFAFYNTFEEIDVFLRAVRRIAEGGTNIG